MARKVLVLTENVDVFASLFPPSKKADCEFIFSPPSSQELRCLIKLMPDCVLLDMTSLNGRAGEEAYNLAREDLRMLPLIILADKEAARKFPADAVITAPLTWRKLSYRLKKLPSDKRFLRAGPLTLDLLRRVLIKGGEELHLTPKLALLLETFMRNRGRVLTRVYLMKKVWDTDYMDDTRTLDVHIHWLRKLIEDDYRSPVYLRTIKKVGYRFDVP